MVFKELYDYREMVRSLVKRDLMGRYKNSALGFLWNFLDPLLQLLIYTMVFTIIIPMGIDQYYLFLFVALVPWIFFSSAVTGGSMVIINQQDMVKKIYFPREVLPLSHVLSQFVNMILSFVVIIAVILVTGHGLSWHALWLPVIMLIEFVYTLGLTFVVSAITVYIRDAQLIVNVAVMALMYASPVIYSVDLVPEKYYNLYMCNPMSVVLVAYRDVLFYMSEPRYLGLGIAAIISLIVCAVGLVVFTKLKRRFVEEL